MDVMEGRYPAVVIDIGSGFTKMGYAGNTEPQSVVPTCVAKMGGTRGSVHSSMNKHLDDDFFIGHEAYSRKDSDAYLLSYPVSKGRIENWNDMERFLHLALYRHLRCTPEEHLFLLTEPPFNAAENREQTAEIMFETFNVKGLHIGVQAVLSLYAQWVNDVKIDNPGATPDLTGMVVDAGDGLTQVIPVADGYVIGSCIQEVPIGGRDATQYIVDVLKDRKEPVPAELRMDAARQIKEKFCYVCQDAGEEKSKYTANGSKIKSLSGLTPMSKEPWSISVQSERFMAPEIFFEPDIFTVPRDLPATTPLADAVDNSILKCPIDYRRRLYGNILLSGGSTTFMHFKERLNRDVQLRVDARLRKLQTPEGVSPAPIKVHVGGGTGKRLVHQRYAAWLGGSLFAAEQNFVNACKTRADYYEHGPSCMRGIPMLLA